MDPMKIAQNLASITGKEQFITDYGNGRRILRGTNGTVIDDGPCKYPEYEYFKDYPAMVDGKKTRVHLWPNEEWSVFIPDEGWETVKFDDITFL